MRYTRIEIDLNVRTRGNETYAGVVDVHEGAVAEGMHVYAVQSDDEVMFDAWITELDFARNLIYMRVDWASGRDDECEPGIRYHAGARCTCAEP